MVDGLGEFVLELAAGMLEGVYDWLAGGGSIDVGDPNHAHNDAISRYATSLYEERPFSTGTAVNSASR